jgi:hypothetical protein
MAAADRRTPGASHLTALQRRLRAFCLQHRAPTSRAPFSLHPLAASPSSSSFSSSSSTSASSSSDHYEELTLRINGELGLRTFTFYPSSVHSVQLRVRFPLQFPRCAPLAHLDGFVLRPSPLPTADAITPFAHPSVCSESRRVVPAFGDRWDARISLGEYIRALVTVFRSSPPLASPVQWPASLRERLSEYV